MKEIPILFSTQMVQAILDGRKTMTRRIIKPQAPEECKFIGSIYHSEKNKTGFYWTDNIEGDMQGFWPGTFEDIFCPYGQPGDVLWVRESFSFWLDAIKYKADGESVLKGFKYKPSIHMPKNYARIWLQVEEIRVERLHEITEEDAIAEGIKVFEKGTDWLEAKFGFEILWEKINGLESWNVNPWVWVVKFKVLSTTGKPETI